MNKKEKDINQRKVVTVLRTFNKDEWKGLNQFVNSPYFNTNPRICTLFSFLRKRAPIFKTDLLKTVIINKVYSKNYSKQATLSKKDNDNLTDLLHKLYKLVEEFLAISKFRENEIYKNYLGIDALLEKKLLDESESLIVKSQAFLENKPYRDRKYYRESYLIGEKLLSYNIIRANRSKEVGMQELINAYHKSYFANLLRLYCAAINRENILNVSYDYPLLDELLSYLEKIGGMEEPFIEIYFHNLMLLKRKEEEKGHFGKLKKCMDAYHTFFPKDELRQMYSFMANHCRAMIREGHMEYNGELFDLLKNTLKMGLWNSDISFNPNVFVQIIKTGLGAEKPDWTSDFIQQYKEEIQPSVLALSLAYLHFYQGAFDEAKRQLLKIENHEDFLYDFFFRLLGIQIAYEQVRDFDSDEKMKKFLFTQIENLRFFIDRRQKNEDRPMAKETLDGFKNFYKYVKRLAQLKVEAPWHLVSPQKATNLLAQIEGEHLLDERNWLMKKAVELKGLLTG